MPDLHGNGRKILVGLLAISVTVNIAAISYGFGDRSSSEELREHESKFGHVGMSERVGSMEEDIHEMKEAILRIETLMLESRARQ